MAFPKAYRLGPRTVKDYINVLVELGKVISFRKEETEGQNTAIPKATTI